MKAVKKLLLSGAAMLTLAGCTVMWEDMPPSFDDFKEEAEWELYDHGYEELEFLDFDEQDSGWRYHFNYNASRNNRDYEVGVSCEADRDAEDTDKIYSRITSSHYRY